MSAVIAAVTTAVVFTGYSIYQGEKASKQQEEALKMQREAQAQATAQAQAQAKSSEEAINKANRKSPNMTTIMEQAAGRDAMSATMLTGPQGVQTSSLNLGKSTLLGG